VTSSPW